MKQDERIQMLEARVAILEHVLVAYLVRTLAPESITSLLQSLGDDSLSKFDFPARKSFRETILRLNREILRADLGKLRRLEDIEDI